ncbi:MAG: ABC transporter permease, partial [Bacteroidota bacterium]
MYRLFLKIATRYLLKNKLYSVINIFGLALGIASFVLIMLYVNYERSYDTFTGSENVHRVYMDYLEGGEWVAGDANSYIVSGPTLQDEFPEIQDFVRFRKMNGIVLTRNNAVFDHNTGALADPSYFSIFDRTLSKGDLQTALEEPYSMVLSETLAQKVFGTEDPVGKTLKIAGAGDEAFTVSGVMEGTVKNTHIKKDFLISFKTFYTWPVFENDWKYTWNGNEYYTYLKVDPNADMVALNEKIMALEPKGLKNERHHLEPIADIHLHSNKPYEAEINGSANSIRLLAIIAFIAIILSWMNYMNLSTSKSLERAKEIGVRKVVGAKRSQLILQALVESGLLNTLAIILALGAVLALLPAFNAFVGQELELNATQIKGLIPYLGFIFLGGMGSAFYPAFVLSKYKATQVLKGGVQTSNSGLNLRRGLIITQFLATIVLLTGAFVAQKQIRFLQERPIGVELNKLLSLNGRVLNVENDSLVRAHFFTLVEEIKKNPGVAHATTAQTYPGADFGDLNSSFGVTFPDGRENDNRIWYNYAVQPDYFELMGMQFVAGGAFSQTASGKSNSIVINERFVRFMGVSDPETLMGKSLKFWEQDWPIAGVVKDYHHFGLKTAIEPLIMTHNKPMGNLLVKLEKGSASMAAITETLHKLEETWHTAFPRSTYNYTFLDQRFQEQYTEDKKFADAFRIFTALAILIASLGLFGLTSYTVMQRKKEIGIRKVNGATITQILTLLNTNFIK